MRKWVALVLGVLVPLLGLAGVGNAQSTVQVQGTIQAVDCQQGTIVVATPDSVNTIAVAPYTTVLVDSQAASLCDLQQYVGSQATVWLVPSGNEFIATRIVTTAPAAVAPVALPAQQEAIAPLPIAGIVLGTILLAGLVYLLVRDGEGHYWRYPYYGSYYRYYHRPEYREYAGPYPAVWPVVYAAAPLAGIVLGVTVFSGLEYLIVRDRDGRYERYPYYGPYRSYYYRPEYRSYSGSYRGDAPVRYGDTRGSVVFQRQYQQQPYNYQRPQQYQQQQPYNYQRPQQYQQQRPQQYQQQQPYNYQRPQQYQQQQPYNYQRPQQYQQQRPQQYQQQQPYNYQRPQQYQQQQPYNYQRPQQYQQQQPYNYQRPQQYQQQRPQQYQQQQPYNYQRPQQYQRSNYTPAGNGTSRGRDTRQTCQSNAQGQSCSDGTHNR